MIIKIEDKDLRQAILAEVRSALKTIVRSEVQSIIQTESARLLEVAFNKAVEDFSKSWSSSQLLRNMEKGIAEACKNYVLRNVNAVAVMTQVMKDDANLMAHFDHVITQSAEQILPSRFLKALKQVEDTEDRGLVSTASETAVYEEPPHPQSSTQP